VGFVENIKDFLESIDIFVSTSLHEGSSNVILEVMAAGKAIVGFDVSSIPEMVQHEHNGLLVPLGRVDAMTEAVVRLMGDAVLRENMGRNGRKRVEEHFSITNMFAQLERMIEHG
jgi:glycosyltransferase involved in cell wall biosynthesis